MAFEFTDENFAEATATGVALVHFWAEWAGPSRTMKPVIEKLAAEYSGRALVGNLDVDNNPEVPMNYLIRGVSSFLILKNGEMVNKFPGTWSKEYLANKLDAALAV
ncbi:MAG: thioredoxin [Saprospiraceae bacterium]|nr:thioredoxin [Saprospiraceae bacterium]